MIVNKICTPVTDEVIHSLKIGDVLEITGTIYVGRDAVLPKIVKLVEANDLESYGIDLAGGVIFHSAVSEAGIGPTSSNKIEIEGSFSTLSRAGVKIHLGKGALKKETVEILQERQAIYCVTPPISAYLTKKALSRSVAAFAEEGIEAFWRLEVRDFPCIVAIAHGESIYRSISI